MKKTEKAEVVNEIEEKLKKAVSAVLTDYRGLNVNDLAELRGELRKEGVEYKVYKNTLMKRAVEKADLAELATHLNGPTALAFSFDDPVAAARLVAGYAKTNKALKIKAGLFEGRVLGAAEMKILATLPPREVLLAKLAGTLNAPISGLVNTLQGPLRGLAMTLGQVAEAKK